MLDGLKIVHEIPQEILQLINPEIFADELTQIDARSAELRQNPHIFRRYCELLLEDLVEEVTENGGSPE